LDLERKLKPSPRMKALYFAYALSAAILGVFSWSIPLALAIPEAVALLALLLWLPTIACLLLFAYWLPRYYRSVEYVLEGSRVVARRGVWWKRESSIPLAKVNDVVWEQGPLQRALGLATLGFHTAAKGVQAPEVSFDHLDAAEAEDVREAVLAEVGKVEPPAERELEGVFEEMVEELRAIRRLLEERDRA